MKEINNVELYKIRNIKVEDDDLIDVEISEDGFDLLLKCKINPYVIDKNFSEIEYRLLNIEKRINKEENE